VGGTKSEPVEVRYRFGRDGVTAHVDRETVPLRLLGSEVAAAEPGAPRGVTLRLELTAPDGGPLALRVRVLAVPDGGGPGDDVDAAGGQVTVHVDSPLGATSFREVPRHPEPRSRVAAGSLTASVPGRVVAVHVREGDAVEAGQPLLVIEAMKMEHPVSAPAAGVVSLVAVSVGDQAKAGDVLAVVES